MQGFRSSRSQTKYFHAAHEVQRVAVGNAEERDELEVSSLIEPHSIPPAKVSSQHIELALISQPGVCLGSAAPQ